MSGLLPVDLQAVAHELTSLAANLHCCNQELAERPQEFLMQRVLEQVQRLRAVIPVPSALADCDLLARTDLADVVAWLDAIEPQLRDIKPPFRTSELRLVYAWASKFDAHAHRAAMRMSIAPPFTEFARNELQQRYGATESLRRQHADEPDDAVSRINSGMEEALHRFPDLDRWTADDWSWLFFSSPDIVEQTPVWHTIQSRRIQLVPGPLTLRDICRVESMDVITDSTLRSDPLWLALDRVIRAIREDRRTLFSKHPSSEQCCNSDLINSLAAEAFLAKRPVFEVRDVLQGVVKTDCWLKVHHPEIDEPVELVIWKLHGTTDVPAAKIDRLLNYLEAWRNKRASQLKPVVVVPQESGSKRRFRVALSFPGERREFVSSVAEYLAAQLGRDRVLYDAYHEAEFARLNLDTHLQKLYHDESDLICMFICDEYEKKEWCGLEVRAIRDVIKTRRESDIMPFRFDMTVVPGLFSIDGYVWVAEREPEEMATLILERLNQARRGE